MSQIKATVIADSISPQGIRLTTFELVYHRFIHSEFMTHRMISKNSASSRAIPTQKLLDQVRNDPMIPVHWGLNQKGMQADHEVSEEARQDAIDRWRWAAGQAADAAEGMMAIGIHKQVANRPLEPYIAMRVIATGTEWNNLFHLRLHKDAQPEFRELAQAMRIAREAATPTLLYPGMWHLPYITPKDTVAVHNYLKHGRITRNEPTSEEVLAVLRRISVARCARVSYNNQEGKPSVITEDLLLYERLVGSVPLHASPTEHQATPDKLIELDNGDMDWMSSEKHGNLNGWIQYRKTLIGENVPG
ncbi:putative thymidilate synthase [Achromobacter phage JWDelta]|uniref:Putative thymidilate synthase n=2 Tax=Jwalphavirus jwalpha TaxID=2169963 RepID=V9VCW5_9CAUD|nr:putative thymidilate synthase [Achromobacter phage JWAlpha]AHC56562.1 putative thymidilate synthase [Achromobacter phage JWDelta]AHC94002.1 putative thymidilate synthase [Achromobacter phage JWAlpha]